MLIIIIRSENKSIHVGYQFTWKSFNTVGRPLLYYILRHLITLSGINGAKSMSDNGNWLTFGSPVCLTSQSLFSSKISKNQWPHISRAECDLLVKRNGKLAVSNFARLHLFMPMHIMRRKHRDAMKYRAIGNGPSGTQPIDKSSLICRIGIQLISVR